MQPLRAGLYQKSAYERRDGKRDDGFVVVNEEVCIGCRYCHGLPVRRAAVQRRQRVYIQSAAVADRVADGKKTDLRESCRCGRGLAR